MFYAIIIAYTAIIPDTYAPRVHAVWLCIMLGLLFVFQDPPCTQQSLLPDPRQRQGC